MSSSLQRLLQQLDPSQTFEPLERRADAAVNSFRVRSAVIDSWPRFQEFMTDFWLHVHCQILGARQDAGYSRSFVCDLAMKTLSDIYGSPSGFKTAFEMTRTGNEGGLYKVLKDVARHLADEQARREISAKVGAYWYGHSVDELLAASTEYLREFGRYLPSELTEGSAARIRANFNKVLERHPALIRRIRHATRSR